ncbi:MAG: thymidine phosphorylase [Rhodobacteraceae bacterium]|nr:MAG: thymidine phosphorylase [Paracoccaceae bacterium]
MLYQELIRRKRDKQALSAAEITALVQGITSGDLGDAQLGAFAMAVVLNGLELPERVALTEAMRDSGTVLEWARGPVIDKHSTGGIGDNVSLMLAPALAVCGAVVPMISGRGLGHTGGTLDKLDAIPGYTTAPDEARVQAVVRDLGCAIIGQTASLAPADKRFYAVRDVTGTVESRDLITASILSKKLAAGLEGLVLDVKCGNGAFMATQAEAVDLARALVEVATGAGCKTVALLTDMNAPLAPAAGNALEVSVAVDFLTGRARFPQLWDVTCALGAEALLLSGLASDLDAARAAMEDAFTSGRAAERFGQMVSALGGPADFMERPDAYLPQAPVIRAVAAPRAGHVAGFKAREIGLAVIELGGGRRQPTDRIDPSVGIAQIVAEGTQVAPGDPLAVIHAADEPAAARAEAAFLAACHLGDAPSERPLILERISAG